jgi:hypothetical protein
MLLSRSMLLWSSKGRRMPCTAMRLHAVARKLAAAGACHACQNQQSRHGHPWSSSMQHALLMACCYQKPQAPVMPFLRHAGHPT